MCLHVIIAGLVLLSATTKKQIVFKPLHFGITIGIIMILVMMLTTALCLLIKKKTTPIQTNETDVPTGRLY